MIGTIETVSNLAQTDCAGNILQLAVAVRRTGQAVERMVGDVKLHDVTTQSGKRFALRANLHACFDGRRARSGVAFAPLDLHEAHAARAEWLETVGRTKLGDIDAGLAGCAQDGRPCPDFRGQAVDLDLYGLGCR